ncbi:MAG TPA: response regulator, partial [Bryobacteraceae bacterium]|nr:response regulator [Bryobacteraceae bacterium]
MNILLIEDNPGDARLIQEALASAGGPELQMHWVDRLAQGMQAAHDGAFDAVLLDLSLPDSRGLETFERFRRHMPGLPVVVLTGLDDEDMALRAAAEGAQDYLVKGTLKSSGILRAVRFAVERNKVAAGAARRAPGRIIGFTGARGGSGTTTIVLNVAAAMVRRGQSVVALE